MKKVLVALALFSSACAFGAVGTIDDTTVIVGSKGPDLYADGTQALVGECYALVWSKDQFSGFKADGTLVNSADKVLIIVSRADENGACPRFAFDIPRSITKDGGMISLWLLDTRSYAQDGTVKTYGAKGTVVSSVPLIASAARVDAEIQIAASGVKNIFGVAGDSVMADLGDDVPAPKIKSIRVENGYAIIEVENTVPFVAYDLKAGETPVAFDDDMAEYPVSGASTKTESITLIKKSNGKGEFFKVGPRSGKPKKN